ncbi:MAG TPA: fibronectin type III domain-containing protein, partial [Chryseosolibacter sp.]
MSSHAQVFPIQSSVSLIPPYSGNLSDYTSPGTQRIRVSLSCNDISITNYRVKLRLTIEGLGITLRSKPNFSYEPFIIDGGSPLILHGDDLIQYLDPRNLDFSGFSKSEYQRTGKLPEGVYRFSIEVLDYNRGTVVSNKGFATAWIVLNDVPILNLPATNSKTRIVDPTNIPFTWTPRHTGSPNSAFTTEYVFRLIEIWPANRNPNDAFLTQVPLYEVETSRSQIVYGPGEPSLIPGRKYAWQVQARDTEGRDLFKNNGKSEVFVFQFGDAIEMPQNVRKETANATTISIRWEASSTGEIPERFRIRFRPEGGMTWYEETTTQYWHTLTGLQNNKAYDIQVRAEAGRQVSDYTFNQRHSTTLPIVDENFQCGNPFNAQVPLMTTPLQTLQRGDMIKCSDFNIRVEEITASTAPSFSGKGFAKVYMFAGAWVEVTFTGTFNAEYQMTAGSVKTTYQKGSKFAQITEEMKKIGENKPNLDSAKASEQSSFITITGIVDSVYMNGKGEIVVVSEDGTEQTYQQKKNADGDKQETIIKDSAGNTWTVDKDGNITKAEAALAGVYSTRDSLNFVVTFKENETDEYGFDADNNFPTPTSTKVNNTDYFVGWKSIEQGKQDFVDASVLGVTKFPKKVGFKIDSQNASSQPATDPAHSKVIFPGSFDGDSQELTAYAKMKASGNEGESEVVLGKLNVVTYEFIQKKVVIVPVNNPTELTGTEIQARLNKIYGQ